MFAEGLAKEEPTAFPAIMEKARKATPDDDGYEPIAVMFEKFGRTCSTKMLSITNAMISWDGKNRHDEPPFWVPMLDSKYHTE